MMPWLLLDCDEEAASIGRDKEKALLLSKYSLCNMQHYEEPFLEEMDWMDSEIRHWLNNEFLEECFVKLRGTIVSCHLKDIRLKPEYTFQLEECACGDGTLNIELYARLATAESPHMPMIIEHLSTDKEYVSSVKYVKTILEA